MCSSSSSFPMSLEIVNENVSFPPYLLIAVLWLQDNIYCHCYDYYWLRQKHFH